MANAVSDTSKSTLLILSDRTRWAARLFRQQFVPGAVVLLYHSIADLHQDPYDLCVLPSHFEGHLKVLSRLGHAVPLPEFARTIRMRKSFRRTFIMTFDDGYADNLINAKPLLDQCCLPATVFVTADHFGTIEQFWWNELAILILQTAEAPELLCVEAGGERKTWSMTKAPPVDFGPKWTLKHPDSASRHTVFRRMHAWLSGLADEDRKSAMYQIRNWAATGRQKTADYGLSGIDLLYCTLSYVLANH